MLKKLLRKWLMSEQQVFVDAFGASDGRTWFEAGLSIKEAAKRCASSRRIRDDLARFMDAFGASEGARFYLDGLTIEQATEQVAKQKEEAARESQLTGRGEVLDYFRDWPN
ncbi:hypothetical protein Mal33_14520 [Rosistilla oblonga]|uniref:Uncharacterized protein n=2 Tax=Rosistilla oblonga TaxID=2527990 RepID=A0A518IQV2_9BACT|nr:hypothetical protein Mal33_14520 [Rosistilla oblonga]